MKSDDSKVFAISYLVMESLNRKELLKVILLLIGEYFRDVSRETLEVEHEDIC
jgi:hypothetical protein